MQRRHAHVVLRVHIDLLLNHEVDDVLLGRLACDHEQRVSVCVARVSQDIVGLQSGEEDLVGLGVAGAVVREQVEEQVGRLLGDLVVHFELLEVRRRGLPHTPAVRGAGVRSAPSSSGSAAASFGHDARGRLFRSSASHLPPVRSREGFRRGRVGKRPCFASAVSLSV